MSLQWALHMFLTYIDITYRQTEVLIEEMLSNSAAYITPILF